MKKFFLLLAVMVCSMSIMTYAETTVTVTSTGDNYTVIVDDVTLSGLTAVKQGDVNVIAVNDSNVQMILRFTDVNTLVADGILNGADFHYATAAAETFASQFQLPNGDFEAWDAPTASGEPNFWHGFKSATGGLAGWAKGTLGSSEDVRPGTTGTHSAVIKSGSTFGIINNGTMTNGRLNASNMSADSPDNHSEMSSDVPNFYMALHAAPDAITTWLKFSQKTANDDYPYSTLSAIAFDGTYYQDPEDHEYTNVAAKAKNNEIAVCDWSQLTIPFDYDTYASNNAATNAILITVSTNATPGQGSNGDQVWIDDMALIYNGNVTNITATGLDGFTFDAATHDYIISYEGDPVTLTTDNFAVIADGHAAIVVKNVTDLGDGSYRIALGAVSADMVNSSLYTITVNRQPDVVFEVGDINGDETVDVSDVNLMINLILNKKTLADCVTNPDLNGSGDVDVSDVNMLINIILHKN